jgi:hypothetical protein
MTPGRGWFVTLRVQVARAGVGFALLLGLLGSVMTFVPGYQAKWFGVAAAGALTGMLSPTRWMRVLAVTLAVFLAGLSWEGFLQGRRYREVQRQRAEILDPALGPARLPR